MSTYIEENYCIVCNNIAEDNDEFCNYHNKCYICGSYRSSFDDGDDDSTVNNQYSCQSCKNYNSELHIAQLMADEADRKYEEWKNRINKIV